MLNITAVATAFAEEAAPAAAAPQSGILNLMPIALVFAIFYFLIIRPQHKKVKVHEEMVASLKQGDSVITNGGLHGRITRVGDDTVTVEIAEKVRVKVTKGAVASSKGGGN